MSYYGRNRYSRSSRRRSGENTALLRALTIILPLMVLIVLGVGVYFAYRDYIKNNPEVEYPQSQSEEQMYSEDESQVLISVIDEDNQLTPDYAPVLSQVDGIQVNSLAVSELQKLRTAAESDGLILNLKSGYVSYAEQQELNRAEQERLQRELEYTPVRAEAEAKKTVPQAGCSEQQTGLLIEFSAEGEENFIQSAAYRWLLRNSNEYGFIQRYPQSDAGTEKKAFFRFVGVENAMKIRSFGMTLDEYNTYLSQK